jgi:hypothetical protein
MPESFAGFGAVATSTRSQRVPVEGLYIRDGTDLTATGWRVGLVSEVVADAQLTSFVEQLARSWAATMVTLETPRSQRICKRTWIF